MNSMGYVLRGNPIHKLDSIFLEMIPEGKQISFEAEG